MPRKQTPEKQIQRLIDETIRGYIVAAQNRGFILEMCKMAADIGRWNEKGPENIRLAAIATRICDTMSHELLNLYALHERLRLLSNKDFRIVIEHVESPWRPDHAQSANGDTEPPPPPYTDPSDR